MLHCAVPIIGLGVDPGLAKTGIAGVARFEDGTYRSLGVRVSRSAPTKDRGFSRMRTSNDDHRRIREHWVQIFNATQLLKPNVIGVENYLTFEPKDVEELRDAAGALLGFLGTSAPSTEDLRRVLSEQHFLPRFAELLCHLAARVSTSSKGIGLGQAAKTIAVFGAALAVGFAAGIPTLVFQPYEIKKFAQLPKGQKASKEQVGAGLERLVHGLTEQMHEKVPQKTLREHGWDATGHAILAADEFAAMRFDLSGAA